MLSIVDIIVVIKDVVIVVVVIVVVVVVIVCKVTRCVDLQTTRSVMLTNDEMPTSTWIGLMSTAAQKRRFTTAIAT